MKKIQYFVGILFSQSLSDKIQAIKKDFSLKYGPKHALKTMPHITIIPPFYTYPYLEKDLIKEMAPVAKKQEPFAIELKGFNYFKNRKSIVLYIEINKNERLKSLHHELILCVNQKFPFLTTGNNRPFRPHLTIAHRDLDNKVFTNAWGYYQHQNFDESYRINHFTLLRHNGRFWMPVNTFQLKNEEDQCH